MSREKQIERIIELICEVRVYNMESRNPKEIAEHLVDNGIGDKDRFEVGWKKGNTQAYMSAGALRRIKPIDYKEGE